MNKISCRFILAALLFFHQTISAQVKSACKLYSPDKITMCELGTDANGRLIYRVVFSGSEIVTWSQMGLTVDNKTMGEHATIQSIVKSAANEKFAWRLGEDDTIYNRYNQITVTCVSSAVPFAITARVFNGSVAFRYEMPKQSLPGISITKENTQFNFTGAYTIYQYNQESVFTPTAIDSFNKTCDFPATLTNGKYYISIGEAVNMNYTKAELVKGERPNSLGVAFRKDAIVKVNNDYQTPWRTISISKTAIGLHAFSHLFLKLAPSSANGILAWIKPGKLIRSQLDTQSGLDCIDFAAKHRFQYIMFDAGWYGAEFRSTSDPRQVIPAIDMPKVIQYGKEKGIGIILYVNYVGLKMKLDTIIPLFKKWGVAGMKFGFVDGLTQDGLDWLSSAIKKVNEAGFIVDIHDNYKPTGLSRTFPALLTQEGIRGDENSPDAFHNTVLPFTRLLAGPADFTFCFPNPSNSYSKNIKVSKAQQLALTVVYFSPLQSIFWYGRPKEYTNESEIEFFNEVPTVWNESTYITGEIGKSIAVARRSGTTWYMGNAAGLTDWKENIKLDFLRKGKKYKATVYEDDDHGSIRKRLLNVQKGDVFPIDIKARGGQAAVIEEVNSK